MIQNAALDNIMATCRDWSTVVEIYSSDTVPTDDGFDPNDALDCFAAASGISFLGVDYKAKIKKIGTIKKSIGKEVNTASVQFANIDRYITAFEFQYGFEGLIMVVRGFSRSMSTQLSHSKIEFAGRCDQPSGGNKETVTVNAKFIIGAVDVRCPRRKFTVDDQDGRVSTDPEFEGFIYTPQYGSTTYTRRVKSGGFLGWWNKKTRVATIAWSGYSDLDQGKSVPEVFGRSQLEFVLIGATDAGTFIRVRLACCEGEIEDIVNARSTDLSLPLHPTNYAELHGLVGTANGPDDPAWVAPGYYSRTAHFRGQIDGSAIDAYEPVPAIVGIVVGRLLPLPDSVGDWVNFAWTDNPAAVTRFLFTDNKYQNLHVNWIDNAAANECYEFNGELIFNTSLSDFIYVEQG